MSADIDKRTGLGFGLDQTKKLYDHLMEVATNPVATFFFNGDDLEALARLIERTELAKKQAYEKIEHLFIPF